MTRRTPFTLLRLLCASALVLSACNAVLGIDQLDNDLSDAAAGNGSGGESGTGATDGGGGFSGGGGTSGTGGMSGVAGGGAGGVAGGQAGTGGSSDASVGGSSGAPGTCTDKSECPPSNPECVDGVCCATACAGICFACSNAKTGLADGICAAIVDGTDPDSECSGADVCNSGTCQCSDGIKDGLEVGADCGGPCATKCPAGTPCTLNSDCQSTYCADGFCCNVGCAGKCEACSAVKTGGADGTCSGIPNGSDPDNECADGGSASCGTDGLCNGSGACRFYGLGTPCGSPASCTGGVQTNQDTCDGLGTCVDKGTTACAPYSCGTTACAVTCTNDTNCSSSTYCESGTCNPKKGNSQICTGANQCLSGFCADGVCCDALCNGTCVACTAAKKGSGADGACGAITGGQDPDNECTPGSCDGAAQQCQCTDGQMNLGETGKDCGGPCPACPPENCANGLDDDLDALTDCADPNCTSAGYACNAAAPTGWNGPVVANGGATAPSCGGSYPTSVYTGNASLSAPAATCSTCTCTTAGASCTSAHVDIGKGVVDPCAQPASVCWALAATETEGACNFGPGGTCPGGGTYFWALRDATAGTWSGTCAASAQNPTKPAATWGLAARACSASAFGAGCGAGQLCAPPPPTGFTNKLCVYKAGDNPCPGAPYTVKTLYYGGFSDTRSCTACGCANGSCAGSILADGDGSGCNGGLGSKPAPGAGCTSFGQVDTAVGFYTTYVVTNKNCQPIQSTPNGSAIPSTPTTFCCVP